MSTCKGKVTLVLNQTEAQDLVRLLESAERFVAAQAPPELSSMAGWRDRLLARLAAKRSLVWERFVLPTTVSEARFLYEWGTPAQRDSLWNPKQRDGPLSCRDIRNWDVATQTHARAPAQMEV
jgi:hypothetical protein